MRADYGSDRVRLPDLTLIFALLSMLPLVRVTVTEYIFSHTRAGKGEPI